MENYLKLKRKKVGYTQKEIAELLGVSRQYYNMIEKNQVVPRVDLVFKMADILNESVYSLFELVANEVISHATN